MADVKLGKKNFSGVNAVKLDTTDGGTVTFKSPTQSASGLYTVTFMNDSAVHTSVATNDCAQITEPVIPTQPSNYFTGWYTAQNGGERVEFPYTPTADVTLYAHYTDKFVLGFTGLASMYADSLTWTDDIANSTGYVTTVNDTLVDVTSPLDRMFPFCEIEEFKDNFNNVFVKYPKCWIKFINDNKGRLTGFKVSNVQAEDDMFIPDCFLNPADDGATYLDYFALGKYEGCDYDGDYLRSLSGKNCRTNLTRSDFRSRAEYFNTASSDDDTYQLQDFSMYILYNFLCMLYYKTANIQKVFGGRTGAGTTSNWSGPSVTGTCDGLAGMNGWNTLTDCVKMLGIENPYGNVAKWIDGIYFVNQNIYVHRLPQLYSDSTVNASTVDVVRPTMDGWVAYLCAGKTEATRSYVYFSTMDNDNANANHYVGDYCDYYVEENVLCVGGFYESNKTAGLWYLNGSIGPAGSSTYTGARLAYRPVQV